MKENMHRLKITNQLLRYDRSGLSADDDLAFLKKKVEQGYSSLTEMKSNQWVLLP